MARDYSIHISVGEGGNRRGAYGGGNVYRTKSTLNSKANKTSEDGSIITNSNLVKVATIGLAFNKAQQTNEIVGAYTENRLRQRKINTGMTFAKYGIGIAVNPTAGSIYALGDLAYRGIMYQIDVQKQNREANYYRRLSGNNANSGSRYRGEYL